MRRAHLAICAAALLTGCAVMQPKPSIWQIESECADSQPISRVEECTRDGLDMQYGDAWHSTPAADQFLDFIGATASRVESGNMSDADGRLAISTYASQAVAAIQADQQAQQAEQSAKLQGALNALMEAGGSSSAAPSLGSDGNVSLFDGTGKPVAYIAMADDMTIYLWGGKPVAYLESVGSGEFNVYGFNGQHLGWFANGVIWDHSGSGSCATKDRVTVAQFEPFKGFKQFKPFKAFPQFAPAVPMFTNSFGDTACEFLLGSGAE